MTTRIRALVMLLLIALAPSGIFAADEPAAIFTAKKATFSWEPATGPVAGYYVIVQRNGGPASVYRSTTSTSETITGKFGDSIIVQVAAHDDNGIAGPLSMPSPTIILSPPANGGGNGSGGGSTPPDDGGTPPAGSFVPLDFTGDGTSDLLVRELATGDLFIWEMNGSIVANVTSLPSMPLDWAVVGNGDYDGNGVADILWQQDGTNFISIWNMAAGAMIASSDYQLDGLETAGDWTVEGSADFDGDGRDDIAMVNRVLGVVEIFRQDDTGAITSWTRFDGYQGSWVVASVSDLDGDGLAEITWSDEIEKRLVVWSFSGPSFVESTLVAESLAGWRVVGSGDHDGDGNTDLLLSNAASQRNQIWFMSGSSVLGSLELPSGTSDSWRPIANGGDYDADGRADIIWLDVDTGALTIWYGTPSGVVAEGITGAALAESEDVVSGAEGADDSSFRMKLCSGDFNGDGVVGMTDFALFSQCQGQAADGICEPVDMDSDGTIGERDYGLLVGVYGGPDCPNGY